MIVDPIRVCELLVGLGDVAVLGAVDDPGGPVRVHVETRSPRPACPGCGSAVWAKDQRPVELVDLPAFGRPARLVWHKRRWICPMPGCAVGSFTETAPHISAARLVMTDRAGRWVTEQVGRWHRSVNELAVELGCDWHAINDTVIAYGTPLIDDPDRIGDVEALGLDETLFARLGMWRTQHWSTQVVNLRAVLDRCVRVVGQTGPGVARRDLLGDVRSLRTLAAGVHHDAARCCPGRGSDASLVVKQRYGWVQEL